MISVLVSLETLFYWNLFFFLSKFILFIYFFLQRYQKYFLSCFFRFIHFFPWCLLVLFKYQVNVAVKCSLKVEEKKKRNQISMLNDPNHLTNHMFPSKSTGMYECNSSFIIWMEENYPIFYILCLPMMQVEFF